MNRLLMCLAWIISLFAIVSAKEPAIKEWQIKHDLEQVRAGFNQPPKWYAPHTFWFWDAPLDVDLAASMAREMTRQGLNPGYAHPRHSGDLNSSYPLLPVEQWLSPLWFISFDAALQEAKSAGMTLGYCDEYWWPSGQAFGRVLAKHPELKAKSLQWTRREITGPCVVQIAAAKFSVAGQVNEKKLLLTNSLKLIAEDSAMTWQVPRGVWAIYSYDLYYHPGADGGEVNYLDPHLMDIFIDIAHEPYATHFKEEMGHAIPGVFVDNEGDYGWKMAWSDYLPVRYRELKGRDMRVWLPLLTDQDDQGLWVKARYDWFEVVSDIYSKHFVGRMSDWLEKHGLYCISNLWEESLMLQTRAVGDFMRMQRSVTLPGTDCLEMNSQQVHDFKETQSVCEFESRPCMSELMGVAGWEQTPVQMKMTLNAVTAWGVTHAVPHGINLNRKLETIPYPADWFTENPYWRYLHLWTDFSRRASFVNRQGRLAADVLLFNPLESVWALSEGYFSSENGDQWPEQAQHINKMYSEAMGVLSRANQDFLIADAHYINKAMVRSLEQKAELQIGRHTFSVLVLPPLFILSRLSAQKILGFAEAGGVVILLGELPKGSPETGALDPAIVEKMTKLKKQASVIDLSIEQNPLARLPEKISAAIDPDVMVNSGKTPLLISHRKIGTADFYWLANNTDKKQLVHLSVRDGSGGAEIWDCETGQITPVAYTRENKYKIVDMTLEPLQAFWLVFDEKTAQAAVKMPGAVVKRMDISGPWQLSFPETDTIKVSSAKIFFMTSPEIESKYVATDFDDSKWNWQTIIGPARLLGLWRASLLYIPEANSEHFFRYRFQLKSRAESALLNVNADNGVTFWVNGRVVPPGQSANNWNGVDLHDISTLLRPGENVIAAKVRNNAGFGYLVMQGTIRMKNGDVVEILTNENWRESPVFVDGWQSTKFDAAAWLSAQKAPADVQQANASRMASPQRVVEKNSSMLWRINIPPSAQKIHLAGLTQKAETWIDGRVVTREKDVIALPLKAKTLSIRVPVGSPGLSAPAEFICRGSVEGPLGSWLKLGLRRFTGFMDYQTTFVLADQSTKAILELGQVLHMAEIWVNDIRVAERLWPPFNADISRAIHKGTNNIRVRVGNLAANEMGVKDDLGRLRLWGWRGTPADSCFNAGLFGPVQIRLEE